MSFGGTLPLRPEGYRFKANFPEATLLAKEADVRMAGVNVGKVRATELGPGGRTTEAEIELDSRFAPVKVDTRAILRQKSLLGETYVELSPGEADSENLPDGGTLRRANVQDTVELDEVFRAFDPTTRRYFQEWLHDAGIASTGQFASDLNDSLGNAAPFFEDGADLLRPLDEQEVALRRVVRDTGRVFDAVSREDGQLRGLITNGQATFSALASRDDALAETFQILPTFLRETRTTVGAAGALRAQHRPARARPARAGRRPGADACATSATCRRTWRSCSATSARSWTPRRPACRRPSASSRARSRCSSPPTCSCASSTRSSPTCPSAAVRSASSCRSAPRRSAGPARVATRPTARASTTSPQLAVIDSRSLQQRSTRPPWDRGNAYIAPNAYTRAIPLGVVESFDCDPNGGEQRNPSGSGGDAEPPCFVAPEQLFQDQQYPRLRPGHAPVVDAPKGTEGNSPARP